MPIPDCLKTAKKVTLEKGTTVFRSGDQCKNFLFILKGEVRVDLVSTSGREVMLYTLGKNETCVLTTSCLLSHEDYNAEATVTRDLSALVLTSKSFHHLIKTSDDFQNLVFASFAKRLGEMMLKVEEVAFVPLDNRLAAKLLHMETDCGKIMTTHERLAADLGTAREVVSRKLQKWETMSFVERGRGFVRILDRPAISKLAQETE